MNLPNVNTSCCGLSREILPVRYEWHKSSAANLNHFTKVFQSTTIAATQNPRWPLEKRNIG